MSIELENPKTGFEKVDAAANYVAQIRIALMARDTTRIEHALERAEKLLFDALRQMEEDGYA